MSFLVRSPVANTSIKDGEYKVSLYESCNYKWDFTQNHEKYEHPVVCCGKSSTDIKYSPVFSASDPVCIWYLVLKEESNIRFNLSLVLRSVKGIDSVHADYKLRLTNGSNEHDAIDTGCTFTVGKASPTINLRSNAVYPWYSNTSIHIAVKAEISAIELKQSDVFYPNARTKLIGDLSTLISKDSFHDIIIKVTSGNTTEDIPAHRNILAARSPVFAAMLAHDMLEKNDGCIEVVDFQASAVKEMLSFMYTGTIRTLTPELASELLKLSDKYDMDDLREVSEAYLSNELNAGNAMDILYLADLCNCKRLKEKTLSFISENFDTFNYFDPFKELNSSGKRLMNEIIAQMSQAMREMKTKETK